MDVDHTFYRIVIVLVLINCQLLYLSIVVKRIYICVTHLELNALKCTKKRTENHSLNNVLFIKCDNVRNIVTPINVGLIILTSD